jgi:hypothetical protein
MVINGGIDIDVYDVVNIIIRHAYNMKNTALLKIFTTKFKASRIYFYKN